MNILAPVSAVELSLLAAYAGAGLLLCYLVYRIYHQSRDDRRLRAEAERAMERASRFSQLTAALAQARTPRLAIEAALQEPLHALNANAGMVLLIDRDGSSAEVARSVGYSTDRFGERLSLADKSPVAEAAERGVPVTFDRGTVVPFLIGGRVAAAVQLELEPGRELTDEERDYLGALSTHAAQALDRTWQLEFAQRARAEAENLRARADQELADRKNMEHALRTSEVMYRSLAARTSRLHALSAALSEAVTLDAVANAVIHHGRTVVGATAGEVVLLVEDGTEFETLFAETDGGSVTERRRWPVESGLCATEAVQTAQPVFVRSFTEWQERYWRSASIAADGGYESSATMPLLVENTPIGVLAFHFTMPVNFDDEYQSLLISVAQHCAQALDRARLYESTQRARAEAEKANRVKDEFVSIVSHELRTPLNAILGWTTMLQRGTLDRERSARALQSICDNASRQARLIDELLDFSRVSSGRMALQMEKVDIRELIRGVVESMIPTAVSRGVELNLSLVPPVEVIGDIRRLEQVFFNLVDNALKFTPQGGRVAIDVRIVEKQVEVRVTDDGVGIEPEFLPFAFERFRQGDSATSRNYGGLGLGLSIAKQLVEAHQGRIAAESAGKGQGATFIVTLPIAAQRLEELSQVRPPDLGSAGQFVRKSATTGQ